MGFPPFEHSTDLSTDMADIFYLRSAVKDPSTSEQLNTETSGCTSQHRSLEEEPGVKTFAFGVEEVS